MMLFKIYLLDLSTVYRVDRYILLESKSEISLHSDNLNNYFNQYYCIVIHSSMFKIFDSYQLLK